MTTAAIALATAWTAPFLAWLARWGYAGVAIGVFLESAGVPVPGETALLAAAFGAAHGVLSLPWIIAVATVASILGDNLGFAAGRRLGRGWAERHGRWVLLTPERLRRVDAFFDRFGPLAVALARFITGVRVVAAFAAGTSRMPWPLFLRYNVLGAVVWATLVSLAGYALGRGYIGVAGSMGHAGVVLAIVVPAALLAAWLLMWFRRRVAGRPAIADFEGAPESVAHAAPARGTTPLAIELRMWAPYLALRWLVVVGISAAGVATFAAIADEVSEGDVAPLDTAVRAFALTHQAPVLYGVFTALTWAGSTLILGVVAAAAALWLWRRAGRGVAATTALAPVVSVLLIVALKALFHRARPDGAAQFAQLGYSFPSGHATGSMAVAVTLAYVLVRQRLAPHWAIAAAVVFSLLVGMSRLYLDVHWATDVAGGWAVGLAVAAACAAQYERLVSRGADTGTDTTGRR